MLRTLAFQVSIQIEIVFWKNKANKVKFDFNKNLIEGSQKIFDLLKDINAPF